MYINPFDKVEILEGYREGDTGVVISMQEQGAVTMCQVEFSNGEVHGYDSDDLDLAENEEEE